jgi:hypothetical protein
MQAVAHSGRIACCLLTVLALASCDAPDAGGPGIGVEAGSEGTAAEGPGVFLARPSLGPDLRVRVGDVLNRLHVDLPENLWSASPGFRFAPVLGRPGRAQLLPHGYDAETDSARVRARWRILGDMAELELKVTNTGDAPARDVRGHVCLHLPPVFQHEDAREVFIFQDGEPLEFSDLATRDGYRASRVWVRSPAGAPGPQKRIGIQRSSPLFSSSRQLADDGVIVVRSADGRWTLGTLWQDAHIVFHNMLSGQQCIHSNPGFGDLSPGSQATRRGWLVLVEGGPQEAHRRLLALRDGATAQ